MQQIIIMHVSNGIICRNHYIFATLRIMQEGYTFQTRPCKSVIELHLCVVRRKHY